MKITITEQAAAKIREKMNGSSKLLKLKYETEGCGCVMSGVPTLTAVGPDDLIESDDVLLDTNEMPIYVEKSKMIFLDDILKIDFSEASNTYQLKSPNQILNGRMAFTGKA
ncbi:iron-sulfur cluster biosynthesis family protein [Falsibacillus albus]|uniref:Iron-sulfur cluster biosynthesis family protein n=1 Tax=Falsibacillus albus TaxID=2478915 RepID=A0A3L7JQ24_9BACI|nr:iron-sulfur cluster biosynthesis family protein [Falsibacillus albus]RLQ90652.1 iron-sulfur cluster biosynthesis family protein [Falsibacillus albus]